MMTRDDWFALLKYCGCAEQEAARWSPVFEQHCQASNFSLGLEEMDDFIGQILTESFWLTRLEENLGYSAARLLQVWPSRFADIDATRGFTYNPKALAMHVYGAPDNRLGNLTPEDGWTYHGRGLIMVTGRSNYAALDSTLGTDYLNQPGLLEDPGNALQVAIAWWEKRVPDAVMGDAVRVTKAVNGGVNGLATRSSITTRARTRLHG